MVLPESHPAAVASRDAAPRAAAAAAAPPKPSAAATVDIGDGTQPPPPSSAPLPPLVIPEEGLDDVDYWLLQTFATLQKRVRQQGLRTGVTYFEESWL